MRITSGNAAMDGELFHSWFVGDLRQWTNDCALEGNAALRQSNIVEMKWGVHRAGETRSAWAPASDHHTMSVVVTGVFLLRFRSPDDRTRVIEQRLQRQGDYAIWGIDVEHTWVVEADALVFTVRWREQHS